MKVSIYQDSKSEWRRTITSSNGKIVGASSEGFSTRQYCGENLKLTVLAGWNYLQSQGMA